MSDDNVEIKEKIAELEGELQEIGKRYDAIRPELKRLRLTALIGVVDAVRLGGFPGRKRRGTVKAVHGMRCDVWVTVYDGAWDAHLNSVVLADWVPRF